MKSIGEVSAFISDGDWIESKDQSERGIRLLQVGNIGLSEFIPKDERAKYISEETYAKLNCTEIFPGDILISRLPEPVGRACIVPDGLGRCITAVDCTILRLNESECDKRYFINYTQSPTYFFKLKRFLTGTTRIRISRKNLESVEIPLPPLDVQRRIAETLDKVSELITLRKTQLEKLDELVKARFVELFGDQESNPFGWEQCSIGECCTLKSGTSLPAEVENEGGSIPYVKVGDMNYPGNERYITTSSRYVSEETAGKGLFEVGSVLFPKRGGAIGTNKKRMTKLPVCADLNVMGVSSNGKLLPEYLFAYFDLIDLGALADGSSVPQINNKNIAPLVICLPPMELQKHFAAFVEQTDKSKVIIQQSLDTLETLKKSLMQEYFG